MDLFSKNKLLFWAVIILALLNIILLGTFWFHNFMRPEHPPMPFPNEHGNFSENHNPEKFHAEDFIVRELQFNEEQTKQFRTMMDDQSKKTSELQGKIHEIRKLILDELFIDNTNKDKIQKLNEEIGKLNTEIEALHSDHFLQMKTLCKPDQLIKFKSIMNDVMINKRPHGHESHRSDTHNIPCEPSPFGR